VDKALIDRRDGAGVVQRRASYATVWRHERDDLPLIYLWAPANIVGLKASITGFRQVPDGLIRLQGMAFQ
jgi:peptide/nickel transport system substrate-binding protein